MESNYLRITEIKGTKANPIIAAEVSLKGQLAGHEIKDFTVQELSEVVRSSPSHDDYLAAVRKQVDHLFKHTTGFASIGPIGILGRPLHLAQLPQRAPTSSTPPPQSLTSSPQTTPIPPPPRPAAPPAPPRPAAPPTPPPSAPPPLASFRHPTADELQDAEKVFGVSGSSSTTERVREAMLLYTITKNPDVNKIRQYVESHPGTTLTRDLFALLEELKQKNPSPSLPPPPPQPMRSTATAAKSSQVEPQMVSRTTTSLREGLLPSPEGPDGYYVVNLVSPRLPPTSGFMGLRHPRSGAISVNPDEARGNLLIDDPQQVRKQYSMRPLPPPPRSGWLPDALGITEDGKHVMQKQSICFSKPSTAAMLLLDKGVAFDAIYRDIIFDIGNLTNLEKDIDILGRAGYQSKSVDLSEGNCLERAGSVIRDHGPIMLELRHPRLGEHYIILDNVDLQKKEVTIRDPMYGAMLTIPAEVFLSWHPGRGIQIL